MKTLLGFACGLVSLFSFACAVSTIHDLVSGVATDGASGALVLFIGITAMAGVPAVRLLRGQRDVVVDDVPLDGARSIDIALEAQVLRLAAQERGRVTVAEVALACGVGLDAAAAALDQLVARGHAELAVADNGSAVYVVHGFVSVEAKHEAEAIA